MVTKALEPRKGQRRDPVGCALSLMSGLCRRSWKQIWGMPIGNSGLGPTSGPQTSLQPSWLSPRVMLVPPELPVARVPLVFRECLVNVVQLVFQAPKVTE